MASTAPDLDAALVLSPETSQVAWLKLRDFELPRDDFKTSAHVQRLDGRMVF